MWDLRPQPGIEATAPALEAQGHWSTREIPTLWFLMVKWIRLKTSPWPAESQEVKKPSLLNQVAFPERVALPLAALAVEMLSRGQTSFHGPAPQTTLQGLLDFWSH